MKSVALTAMLILASNPALHAQRAANRDPKMFAANLSPWRRLANGAERMNLVGRATPVPAEFVAFRERYPANFMCDSTRIHVHQHIGTQHIQVLRGTLVLGFGSEVAYGNAQQYGPGSFIVIPSGAPHYEWNRGELEIHVDAVGLPRIAPVRRADNQVDPASPSTFVAGTCRPAEPEAPPAAANGLSEWRGNRMNLVGATPPSPTELVAFRIRYDRRAISDKGPIAFHYHYGTEHVTILRGTMTAAFGAGGVDSTKAVTYGPGSFIEIPAGAPHAEWIGDELEAHVEFIGPTSATALDPKTGEPR